MHIIIDCDVFLTTLVVCKMPFSFEKRKYILINLFKTNNIVKVRMVWRREFKSTSPSRLTISRVRNKFNNYGKVKNANKERSGRHRSATNEDNVRNVEHL